MATQIQIVLTRHGIKVEPETTQVSRHDAVEWLFYLDRPFSPMRITVYFSSGSPFPWAIKYKDYKTADEVFRHKVAVTDTPLQPGKYKYGVKANDSSTGKGIDDVDPYLIVI